MNKEIFFFGGGGGEGWLVIIVSVWPLGTDFKRKLDRRGHHFLLASFMFDVGPQRPQVS